MGFHAKDQAYKLYTAHLTRCKQKQPMTIFTP